MRFMVQRGWDDGVKPCEGAVKQACLLRDVRTVDCPTRIPLYAGRPELARSDWLRTGKNHRVEDGMIVRDVDGEEWFVEVPDLEALVALCQENGIGAVAKSLASDGCPKLILDANLE